MTISSFAKDENLIFCVICVTRSAKCDINCMSTCHMCEFMRPLTGLLPCNPCKYT